MTKNPHPLRLGMTATAAVLAFTSTPLFAQIADPAPLVTPPPVVTAPAATPAPVTAPTVTTSTAAPMVTPPPVTTAPAITAAPAAPVATRSTPIPNPEPAPVAAPVRAERAAPARTVATPRAAPAEAPAPTAAAPVAATALPAPAPVVVPLPEATPATPAPVQTAQTQTRTVIDWEATGLAGLGGLALLGLAGLMATRRRREDEEDDVLVVETVAPATMAADPFAKPIVMPETELVPAAAVASSARTDVTDGPRTAVPAGFDTSRFGRHTQAAYAGPTADNPFLSLKRRLKRASFMDQRERMARDGVATPQPTMVTAAAPQTATVRTTVNTGHVTTRVPRQPRPTFKPAFQG